MKALKTLVATFLLVLAITPCTAFAETDLDCLAKTIYHEARGESLRGKIAVAWVVLNRVRTHGFPSSVCDVISQPGQFPWRSKKHVQKDLQSYEESVIIADEVLGNFHPDPTNGSLYFQSVRNFEAVYVTRIGSHYFFTNHKNQ